MKTIYHEATCAGNIGDWKGRHRAAVKRAMGVACFYRPGDSVARAIDAWCNYAEAHLRRYETPIGEDSILGPAWAKWGESLRVMLNGETGDFDCGTLDSILVDNLAEQGFES